MSHMRLGFLIMLETLHCVAGALTQKLADEIIIASLVLIHWLNVNVLEFSFPSPRSQNKLSLFVKVPPVSSRTKDCPSKF